MATVKTKTKKSVKVLKELRTDLSSDLPEIREVKKQPFGFVTKLILIVALGSALYLLAQKYRGQFLAGSVNAQPITRWELNSKMAEKYGKQTFDEMVNEKLLSSELKKNNIVVSDEEVKAELDKIIKEYGGEDAFKSALTQYGLTEEKAKDSIRQSIALKKLIEKTYKVEVTDEQVKKYFEDNKKNYANKKLEEVSAEIKETLLQQEVYAKSQEWFTGIRKSAKIVSYL